MGQAALSQTPIVYSGYEPCSREFNLMCFSMLLEHFSDKLSPDCVARIEHSCALAVEGGIIRSSTDWSPLNTNIKSMHIFMIDYFGRRQNRPEWCAYALDMAERMYAEYMKLHAAEEYNSPTYCGVDLSTFGFWRRYGSCERLKELGTALELGIWEDMLDFYNPAMRNFCGPYSRAYELEMGIHTAFPTLFYILLGEGSFPYPPFSNESTSNTLLAFGDLRAPDDLRERVLGKRPETQLTRQFRELSERGEPGRNNALCTATSYISEDLMVGSLAGSENPSYQLHPYVVFWRDEQGLGTIKLLRCNPDGRMIHLHTVLFNGVTEKTHSTMDVTFGVNRDVKLFYEIEYPGISQSAVIGPDKWELPGLTVHLRADAPVPTVERMGDRLRVCYLSEALKAETKKMHFEIDLELSK